MKIRCYVVYKTLICKQNKTCQLETSECQNKAKLVGHTSNDCLTKQLAILLYSLRWQQMTVLSIYIFCKTFCANEQILNSIVICISFFPSLMLGTGFGARALSVAATNSETHSLSMCAQLIHFQLLELVEKPKVISPALKAHRAALISVSRPSTRRLRQVT